MVTTQTNAYHPKHKLFKVLIVLAILVFLGAIWWFGKHNHHSNNSPANSTAASTSNGQTPAKNSFDKTKYSINDPSSIWVIVNKGRILPSDYVPANLVAPNVPLRLSASSSEMHLQQVAATAMEQMFTAAKSDGISLMLASGYRSYTEQIGLYNGYVASQGQAAADASSARPGHSEHQTGLAADVEPASRTCEVEECFDATPEGKWIAANAYKYGFIVRYPKGEDNITGYEYEPWHVRYIGKDLAEQIHETNQTLEQFFNLATYADYPATSYQLAAGK